MVSISSIAKVAGLKSGLSLEVSGSVRENSEGATLELTLKKGIGGGVTLESITRYSSSLAEDFRTIGAMLKDKCSERGKVTKFSTEVDAFTFLDGRPREVVVERHGNIAVKMMSKSDEVTFKGLLLEVCAELHIKTDLF